MNTIKEIRASLKELRKLRDHWQKEALSITNPEHCSWRVESQLLNKLEELEKEPPMGANIIMLLNDTLKAYEKKLDAIGNAAELSKNVSSLKKFVLALIASQVVTTIVILTH